MSGGWRCAEEHDWLHLQAVSWERMEAEPEVSWVGVYLVWKEVDSSTV